MKRSTCKYCRNEIISERSELGYDYCLSERCVSRGLLNDPVIYCSGYVPKPKPTKAQLKQAEKIANRPQIKTTDVVVTRRVLV